MLLLLISEMSLWNIRTLQPVPFPFLHWQNIYLFVFHIHGFVHSAAATIKSLIWNIQMMLHAPFIYLFAWKCHAFNRNSSPSPTSSAPRLQHKFNMTKQENYSRVDCGLLNECAPGWTAIRVHMHRKITPKIENRFRHVWLLRNVKQMWLMCGARRGTTLCFYESVKLTMNK